MSLTDKHFLSLSREVIQNIWEGCLKQIIPSAFELPLFFSFLFTWWWKLATYVTKIQTGLAVSNELSLFHTCWDLFIPFVVTGNLVLAFLESCLLFCCFAGADVSSTKNRRFSRPIQSLLLFHYMFFLQSRFCCLQQFFTHCKTFIHILIDQLAQISLCIVRYIVRYIHSLYTSHYT